MADGTYQVQYAPYEPGRNYQMIQTKKLITKIFIQKEFIKSKLHMKIFLFQEVRFVLMRFQVVIHYVYVLMGQVLNMQQPMNQQHLPLKQKVPDKVVLV